MPDSDIVLWSGDSTTLLRDLKPNDLLVTESRFFLPNGVLVSRHGIIGMLLVDHSPKRRTASYSKDDWIGVTIRDEEWHEGDPIVQDPVRRAHYLGTEKGFAILRTFVLPPAVVEVFRRDNFLGEPMISKCACDKVFPDDIEFDEDAALANYSPTADAVPLINHLANIAWANTSVPAHEVNEYLQVRAWLSFHGWFVYAQAMQQAQHALMRGLANFDGFIARFVSDLPTYALKESPPRPELPGT